MVHFGPLGGAFWSAFRSANRTLPIPEFVSEGSIASRKGYAPFRRLFVTCGVFTRYWLFRGFFVALFCLEKQCLGLFRGFFVAFSWLFLGPRFGQNLRVLALEQSSVS